MNCFYLVLLQHLHLSQGPPRVETQGQLAQLGPKQKPLVDDGRWRIVSRLLPSVVQLNLGEGAGAAPLPPHSPWWAQLLYEGLKEPGTDPLIIDADAPRCNTMNRATE